MARSYSIYEAKAKLSELLRIVKAGSEVVVMERGKAIAKVVPLQDQSELKARIEHLEQQGLLITPEAKQFPKASKRKIRGGLKRFLEDR